MTGFADSSKVTGIILWMSSGWSLPIQNIGLETLSFFFSKEDFKASYLHLLSSFFERLGNWPLHCTACFPLLFWSWPEGLCFHTKTGDLLNQKPLTSSSYFRLYQGPVTSQWRIDCLSRLPTPQMIHWLLLKFVFVNVCSMLVCVCVCVIVSGVRVFIPVPYCLNILKLLLLINLEQLSENSWTLNPVLGLRIFSLLIVSSPFLPHLLCISIWAVFPSALACTSWYFQCSSGLLVLLSLL